MFPLWGGGHRGERLPFRANEPASEVETEEVREYDHWRSYIMLGLVFTCGEGGVEERDYHSELMSLHQRWRLKKSGI